MGETFRKGKRQGKREDGRIDWRRGLRLRRPHQSAHLRLRRMKICSISVLCMDLGSLPLRPVSSLYVMSGYGMWCRGVGKSCPSIWRQGEGSRDAFTIADSYFAGGRNVTSLVKLPWQREEWDAIWQAAGAEGRVAEAQRSRRTSSPSFRVCCRTKTSWVADRPPLCRFVHTFFCCGVNCYLHTRDTSTALWQPTAFEQEADMDEQAIDNFREYLRIKTVPPEHDYGSSQGRRGDI